MRFRLGINRVPGLIWLENRFYPNFVPGLAGMIFFCFLEDGKGRGVNGSLVFERQVNLSILRGEQHAQNKILY